MEAELKKLTIERGQIKSALTRFNKYFCESAATVSVRALQKRLEANVGLYDRYNTVQSHIERLVDGSEAAASHASDRDAFEEMYFTLIAEVETFIEKAQVHTRSDSRVTGQAPSPALTNSIAAVKLPTIQLPSFDGSYSDWIKFRDTFVSLVHESELSDVQKFHYLNSALKGSAARVIQSLGVSEANYKLAWESLKARYENSAALRKYHVGALLDMPNIQKQSSTALRDLADDSRNHLAALKSLNEPVELWDSLIVPILARKLDIVSLREWEKGIIGSDRVTFNKFTTFLEERSSYLDNISSQIQVTATRAEFSAGNAGSRKPIRVTSNAASTTAQCPACGSGHLLYRCDKFKGLPIDEKTKIVQKSASCYNCLQTGHRVQACTRKFCDLCGRKHHILLHREYATQSIKKSPQESSVIEPNNVTSCVANLQDKTWDHSVLSTAIVNIKNKIGQYVECRALLDSGSQANFITYEMCDRLGIKLNSIDVQIAGIGGNKKISRDNVTLTIESRINNFSSTISCLLIDCITQDMPNISIDRSRISVPSHIKLADPDFDRCRPIDMLIGSGLFWHLLCVGQHKAQSNLLWQKTQLGWVLGGQIAWPIQKKLPIQKCYLVTNQELSNQLEQFWSIEHLGSNKDIELDECEIHFQATTRRDVTGRYIVQIPFNEQLGKLGTSRQQAEKRFRSLEAKLLRQPDLRDQYVQFMREYENLGHMSRISVPNLDRCGHSFYLPHHAVTKIESTTTKLRVVFDGSAKSSTGISLNDTQKVGPTVQSELVEILLRFRTHQFVLSADIEKMYRQILIEPAQRCFQRILWRPDNTSPIETFELNTITYGTASAPFLATRTLKQIGLECAQEFPVVSRIIINDFYVDDLLTGLDTVDELRYVKEKLSQVVGQAGLKLRKWASNSAALTEQGSNIEHIELSADKDPKTLGLHWSTVEDELHFMIKPSTNSRVTKRQILSEISQIFDPLGLIGPVITCAKLVMQQLWQLRTDWDESVCQEIHHQWVEYRKELEYLSRIRIPRRALVSLVQVELHGFSDASERAYGACVYLRSREKSGNWETGLLCSKSRVAPLKTVSLPRLELCGALLLAQLISKVKSALRIQICDERYWCDSTITLAWIHSIPGRWKVFVANRVAQIQALTDKEKWSHVSSSENPADLISRGISPNKLESQQVWWSGPSWLQREAQHWPQLSVKLDSIPDERKKSVVVAVSCSDIRQFFNRYSEFKRLVRVIAYCLRFVNNSRKHRKSEGKGLTVDELVGAQETLIRMAQKEMFSTEFNILNKGQDVLKQSPLKSLAPFIDEAGIIRVGGRLNNAPIAYSNKHPILLPAKHPLTDLIIKDEHHRLLHAGCQHVVASLRERYWPINCMQNVKRVVRNCVRCFRVNPQGIQYPMGQLPAVRVTPARPFLNCGVDYAGPFTTKDRTRSKVTLKSYICIFVCFATKAIHIELATDLSTDAFINCLRRFIARRGRCQQIFSDNGTNFVGAKNKLSDLDKLVRNSEHNSKIDTFLSNEQIQWNFIPPQAPHFGGLWESAVRRAKHHLIRVIGDQRLTYEELYTLLTQIEACLNSRPLSPISSDPHDCTPLTPGHFLIGTALTALPEPDFTDVRTNRLNRYQLIQQMLQHFWQRWQKEYLHHLQQRNKWTATGNHQLSKGTLVVIKEDNLPPLRWCLGRITELHQGKDGVVRVVSVKTGDGLYKRPITKICILPMQDPSDSE
ncbi:uncharacterized protein LOC105662854 [Megachile rotundata]|uniref:uncharacterized protein LOC105662854 n=1 Tax=Megachile rotundata TaxID=143995 RepID=UPI003FD4E5CF